MPLAHGETVVAVHLFWERPDAFGLDMRASVARLAEHAGLAIAIRRLLAALQGMASTDVEADTDAARQELTNDVNPSPMGPGATPSRRRERTRVAS